MLKRLKDHLKVRSYVKEMKGFGSSCSKFSFIKVKNYFKMRSYAKELKKFEREEKELFSREEYLKVRDQLNLARVKPDHLSNVIVALSLEKPSKKV